MEDPLQKIRNGLRRNEQVAQEAPKSALSLDPLQRIRNTLRDKMQTSRQQPMLTRYERPDSRLYAAVEKVESGGNPRAVSPKGAIGPMQTMPKTLLDPGFGVTPAKDRSIPELRRVGRDYLDAMNKRYGPIGGLAAYNWGPGNWEKALKRANGNVDKALQSAPKETRDYIPKVMTELNRR
jgi:soluble lytic murein transglycosylase-like protein